MEARGIHKFYHSGDKQLEVLRGVDLKLRHGQFIAIVGPSGAGKSTLLHILGGLDSPSQGQVIFEGSDIYKLDDQQVSRVRNSRIGFVFQFYHLLSEFTVLENVLMPALVGSGNADISSVRNRALELLEGIGLGARAGHFPAELSGGEQQRAAIARALINQPGLLLCDEPTGNLDSRCGEEIISLIKRINTDSRMAVVLVTHNKELAAMAESIYYLKDGILMN